MRLRVVVPIAACLLLSAPVVHPATDDKKDLEAIQKQIQALVAGQAAIQKQLDEIRALLKERPPAAAAAPLPARPPGPAPGALINLAGAPTKGPANAKVVVVEFSDYQCPFCGRFYRESLNQIQRDYIDTGKIRYVFRNLPLESIHPHAFKAHEAGMCAADQDKYWQMHDQLFANQRALDPDSLIAHAKSVGLDLPAFQQCLASGKYEKRVREDLAEAEALGANGTPAFFIGTLAPGEKMKSARFINGARPYADFKAAIDALLAQ